MRMDRQSNQVIALNLGRELQEIGDLLDGFLHVVRGQVLIQRAVVFPAFDDTEIAMIGRVLEQVVLITPELAARGSDQTDQRGLDRLLFAFLGSEARDHMNSGCHLALPHR